MKSLTFTLSVMLVCLLFTAAPFAATTHIEANGSTALSFGCLGSTTEAYTGSGSWQADNSKPYVEFYFYIDEATLGTSITVGDIESISYRTKDGSLAPYGSGVDFFVAIYTQPFVGGDSWYGHRLNAEPLYSNNYSYTAAAWNHWVTDGATNELTWIDHNHANLIGGYGGPTLADIQAGPITWSDYFGSGDLTPIDYASEEVWLIKFGTGTAWAASFDGHIDDLVMILKPAAGGDTLSFDFEGAGGIHNVTATTDHYTFQDAIDNATAGDVITADPGYYTQSFVLDKQLAITGAGSGENLTNTIVAPGANTTVCEITATGTMANPMLLGGMRFNPIEASGVLVSADCDYLELDNLHIVGSNPETDTENEVGLKILNPVSVNNLTVTDCAFDNLTYGWYFFKNNSTYYPPGGPMVDQVDVSNTSFNYNDAKGMYVEKLSNATFTNCDVIGNGQFLGFFNAAWHAGLDINLKGQETYQNFVFDGCTFQNNALGLKEGVGLAVKGRGTGSDPSYAAYPAVVNNVQVLNCLFDGNERGLRIGEPGKSNTSPTNVTVFHTEFSNNVQTYGGVDGSAYGSLVNQATPQVAATDNYWGTVTIAGVSAENFGNVDFDPWCADNSFTVCNLTASGPSIVYVDDDYTSGSAGGHLWGYDAFDNIGDGLAAVQAGGTVEVGPGTYVEQVHVTKDVTLNGDGVGSSLIHSPASLTSFFTTTNDNYPVVFVDNATVDMTGFTVDGLGLGNANYRMVGVAYSEASGTIADCYVTGIRNTPFDGAQHGLGIYATAAASPNQTVDIINCTVDDFQKNGITGTGAYLTMNVSDCIVTGAGPTSTIAQNGIQFGCAGSATNCDVTGINYTGATWSATGFLVQGLYNVVADDIGLDGCQTSVYWIDGSGSFTNGSITNPIGDGFYLYRGAAASALGAEDRLMAQPIDPQMPDAKAQRSKSAAPSVVNLTNTTLTGTGAVASWGIGAFSTSTETAVLNVSGCTINNWDYGIFAYDYGGPVEVTANDNDLSGNTYALGSTMATQQNAQFNWFGAADEATVAGMVDGDWLYSPWYGANYVGDPHTTPWTWVASTNGTIQAAIDAASANDIVNVSAGSYNETIVIYKPLTVAGLSKPVLDGASLSGTAVSVTSGDVTFDNFEIANYTSSGNGVVVGYESTPPGNLHNVTLTNLLVHDIAHTTHGFGIYIGYESEGFGYPVGDPARITAHLDYEGLYVANNEVYNTTNAAMVLQSITSAGAALQVADNNLHDAGASGLWIDCGRNLNLVGNTMANNSFGVFLSAYAESWYTEDGPYGPKDLTFDGNQVVGNANLGIGLYNGWPSTILFSNNNISGNSTGFQNFLTGAVDAENNYWGSYGGPLDNSGTQEATIGSCFPAADMKNQTAEIHGSLGNEVVGTVDYCPWVSSGIVFTPDDILYYCDPDDLVFDVFLAASVTDLEGANLRLIYPGQLTLSNLAVADANFEILPPTFSADGVGTDTVTIPLLVKTGSATGPQTLFTVTMNSSDDICTSSDIYADYLLMRDSNNDSIPSPLPNAVAVVADCGDPDMVVTAPASGQYFTVTNTPVLTLQATDNCEIDSIFYSLDNCNGTWSLLAADVGTAAYNNAGWSIPGYAGLANGNHCVYFQVVDVNGRRFADSCSYSWCFIKDALPPASPTALRALPGHNRIKLSWTNPPNSDLAGIRIQRVRWNGYPAYGAPVPGYPVNQTQGNTVYDGPSTSHIDIQDLNDGTRDIYYYAAFAYDSAGNFSVGVPSSRDRAASYWLGDVGGSGGFGDYDGFVYAEDLNPLYTAYGTSTGNPGFVGEVDYGPTVTGNLDSIPVPDGVIDFEDGIIFAINFDRVSPTLKGVPMFAGQTVNGPLGLALERDPNAETETWKLLLENNDASVKGFSVLVKHDATQTLRTLELSEAAEESGLPIFHKAVPTEQGTRFDFMLLGKGMPIVGSGTVAELTFSTPSDASAPIELADVVMRDLENNELRAAVRTSVGATVPDRFALSQNYPNPFNPATVINFSLPVAGETRLEVYNMLGQRVALLLDERLEAGTYDVTWQARDDAGNRVASGIYLYRLTAGAFSETRKMILLK